jgi:hypothetical protein
VQKYGGNYQNNSHIKLGAKNVFSHLDTVFGPVHGKRVMET